MAKIIIDGVIKIRYALPEDTAGAKYVDKEGWTYLIDKVLTICVSTVFIDSDTVTEALEKLDKEADIVLRYNEVIFVANSWYMQSKPIIEKLYYTTVDMDNLNKWLSSKKKDRDEYVPPRNIYSGTHIRQRRVSSFTDVQPITLLSLLKAGVTCIRARQPITRDILELDIADFIESCKFRWTYPKKIINPFAWNLKNAFSELVHYPGSYPGGDGYYKYEGRGCDVYSNVPQPGVNYKYTVAYDKSKSSMVPTVVRAPEGGKYIELYASFYNSIPALYRMYYVELEKCTCLIGYQRVYTPAERKANRAHVYKFLRTPRAKALQATAWLFDTLGTTTAEDIEGILASGMSWKDLILHALSYETYTFGTELKLHGCISNLVSYKVISINEIPDIYTYEPNGLTCRDKQDSHCRRLAYDAGEREFLLYDEYEFRRYADELGDSSSDDDYDDKSNDEILYGGN